MLKYRDAFLFAATLTAISGCSPSGPESSLDNYLTRLSRTLGETAPVRKIQPQPMLPRAAQLKLTVAGSSLDTLDFLALSGCAVQVTIGKRNSSLGRMARDSQRLLLDLEYLQLAPACIDHLRKQGQTTLAATLVQARQDKQQQLPARIFNATLGNEEYRQFWQPPAQLGNYPALTSTAVVSALNSINSQVDRWLSGDYDFDNREFEVLLSEVRKGDGGSLLVAASLQSAWLAAANSALQSRRSRKPLCREGHQSQDSKTLKTVVHKYLVAQVQPWSASLAARYYQLLASIRELETSLAHALPDNYKPWRDSRDQLLAQLISAPRSHIREIQQTQASCPPKH
jgi:hypothetical protein